MDSRQSIGRAGEEEAAEYLLGIGYTLITRRFRVRQGEIDIICLDGDVLVFVEVKSRRAPDYVPEEAIGEIKLKRLSLAAQEYMKRHDEQRNFRFDIIAIDGAGLRHHRHIFNR